MMALASEDIWANVDMNSSDNIDLLLDCVAENSGLRLARSLKDDTDSLVPDIADIMLGSPGCSLSDIGIDMDFDNFLDDILRLEEEEPLRQDCMWSGQDGEYSTNFGEQLLRQQKKEAKPRLDTLPTASVDLTDISSKDLSCFDTPLSSETSDLDETSSDLEAEAETIKSKVDSMFSDHCYTSTSPQHHDRLAADLLTPNDSSEEDEVKQTKPTTKHIKSFQPVNTFRVPSFPTPRLQDSSSRSRKPNQAKFKFHMKFKPTTNSTKTITNSSIKNTSSLTARSLLRQNSSVLKKKSLARSSSSLIPYSSKSIQVSQTRVSVGSDSESALARLASAKPSNVRDLHNSLERQRRIDLRNAFDTLRQNVPELRAADKASKLLILNKSRDYCWKLTSREATLAKELKVLKAKQQSLLRQLKQK